MTEAQIKKRHELLSPFLDEKILRLYVAAEASSYGFGGVSKIARITGISRPTIIAGTKELLQGVDAASNERTRKEGGGRKRTIEQDPTLRTDLESLIEPTTRGHPESPLRWTCKSVRNLAG